MEQDARRRREALVDAGLVAAAFVLGALLVGCTVATFGLTTRPGAREVGVALGVAAAFLLVFVRMASVVERSHLVEYAIVATFVQEALAERARHGRRVPAPELLAVVVTAAVGVLDEAIQAFLPTRVFDPVDIVFNVSAGAAAVAVRWALGLVRRRRPAR